MIETKVDLSAFKREAAKLKKMSKKVANLESAHKKIATYFAKWVGINFKTQGAIIGGWAPFKYGGRLVSKTKKTAKGGRVRNKSASAQSVLNRRHIDPSAKLLQDHGDLRKSFLPFWSNKNAGIGSKLKYSKTHEKGIGNTPKRRILPKLGEVSADVRRVYNEHIEKAKKSAGIK